MPARLAAWITGALVLAVVLSLVAPGLAFLVLFTLAVPFAVVARLLAARRANGDQERDAAQTLVSATATITADRTSSSGTQVDWRAALVAELASISVPRERRRFALGAAHAMLGTPHRLRSTLVAAGLAVAFAAVLMGFSRATVGGDGVGSLSVLLPPVMLFAIGFVSARSTRSLRFGIETGVLAAAATLLAMGVILGIEAARWFDAAHVSVLDGEYVDVDTSRAAVLDAVHPIILLVHLLFWLPWPVLGAVAGARATRRGAARRASS